jgi:hypothetical protein
MRVGSILIDARLLPADATMPIINPASQLLATILELPSPTGDRVWITGNR